MNRKSALALASAAALTGMLCLAPPAQAAPSPTGLAHRAVDVCGAPAAGHARCHAKVVVDQSGSPLATAAPNGYGPADLQSAYQLSGASSGGRTVAIIDAYDAPTAEQDLGVYRSTFGLTACTTANGCFRKVSQTGSSSTLPAANGGWAQEISLDVDMVSATCPDCKILLVEANSATNSDLAAAVNYAASQPGVVAISNSYGGRDGSALPAYNHPGIAITASTGDGGYGVESPASYPTVIAVGGTSLTRSATARGWSESAWSGAGSGCSRYNSKPAWQTAATRCSGKANADVSAVADPNTGVAVYDSYAYQGASGWLQFGGTSVSSPVIASVFALGGVHSSYPAADIWSHAANLNDVTTGSNGRCSTKVWCTAGTGWDGPTGLGTPVGVTAF